MGLTPEIQALVDRALAAWRRGATTEANFRVIAEAYYPRLLRFFAARFSESSAAHDLTQETFVRIYSAMDTFRGDSSFETWAFTVAGNVLRQALREGRAQKRGAGQTTTRLEDLGEDDTLVGEGPDPLEVLVQAEDLARLRQAIEALPPRMRTVLKLYCYQNRSRQEIAEALGVSAETVKAQLFQARRRLMLLLRGAVDGSEPEAP